MVDDSHTFSLLKQKVEERLGLKPRTPNDFRTLSAEIRRTVGQTLGVTTLKRLWGYVKNPNSPTFSTLTILCRYVGETDWYSFCALNNMPGGSGFNQQKTLYATDVPEGDTIRVHWGNNKNCLLLKLDSGSRFRVLASRNVKLDVDDVIVVPVIMLGEPFTVTECQRGDVAMGSYTSGKHGLVQIIER